jgi:hypothetical protein
MPEILAREPFATAISGVRSGGPRLAQKLVPNVTHDPPRGFVTIERKDRWERAISPLLPWRPIKRHRRRAGGAVATDAVDRIGHRLRCRADLQPR